MPSRRISKQFTREYEPIGPALRALRNATPREARRRRRLPTLLLIAVTVIAGFAAPIVIQSTGVIDLHFPSSSYTATASPSVATTPTQDLDVKEFAAKHGISTEDAQRLIEEVGYDTSELNAAAQKLKLER